MTHLAREIFSIDLQPTQLSALVAGTATRQLSLALEHFDFCILYYTASGGVGTFTMDIYLQRKVDETLADTDDDAWDDYGHYPQQAAAAAALTRVIALPIVAVPTANTFTIGGGWARAIESPAADTFRLDHWGSKLRVREVIAGVGPFTTAISYRISAQFFRTIQQ